MIEIKHRRTGANLRGVNVYDGEGVLEPDQSRPAERFFLGIARGDTPATNPVSAVVEGWIVEWMAERAEVSS